MKILIIDNNIDPGCWGAENIRTYCRRIPNATLVIRRAPENDLPDSPAGFDRIIVSGSKTSSLEDFPWMGRLIEFTQAAIAARKPYLGVCFGHQILARSMGGKQNLRVAAVPEFGWSQINLLESSDLFKGLDRSFHSFSSHYEEISQLPPGMKKLAESELCAIQACQLEGNPVFGIQFHPERSAEDAQKTFMEKRNTKEIKLLHSKRTQELYNPKIAETIFDNFFQL